MKNTFIWKLELMWPDLGVSSAKSRVIWRPRIKNHHSRNLSAKWPRKHVSHNKLVTCDIPSNIWRFFSFFFFFLQKNVNMTFRHVNYVCLKRGQNPRRNRYCGGRWGMSWRHRPPMCRSHPPMSNSWYSPCFERKMTLMRPKSPTLPPHTQVRVCGVKGIR